LDLATDKLLFLGWRFVEIRCGWHEGSRLKKKQRGG